MAIKEGVVDKSFRGSPQELVSCDTNDYGCGGGNTVTAYGYLANHGLETSKDYPYTRYCLSLCQILSRW